MEIYPVGGPVEEIQTPALLLDLDRFQWNIDKMFKFANRAGVNVRPHAKTFKAAAICNRLLEAGAVGLMTQKLGEAEALLNCGLLYGDKNILVSQELADPFKIKRLVGMNAAMGEGKVLATLENVEEARLLDKAAAKWGIKQHVVIELSHGRCGVASSKEAVDLAKKITAFKRLEFRGIYGYEGPVEKELANERNRITVSTADMIREAGIEVEIVSAGSTGTHEVTGMYPGITEIQPGSFVFGTGPEGTGYGFATVNNAYFKSSLSVLTQIIGCNFPDRVVTDAGLKVMSAGFGPPRVRIDDELVDCEEVSLSEEHGAIRFKEGSDIRNRLMWGQKIEFIPSHCCTCINQHNNIFVIKDSKLAAVWPITARGRYH
ncbi:MAG: alanine racemase [Candidatus Bathyarchaeota archaeon]|nr:alanine racemase [Candidatus Bathyarchaeota archaeon]